MEMDSSQPRSTSQSSPLPEQEITEVFDNSELVINNASDLFSTSPTPTHTYDSSPQTHTVDSPQACTLDSSHQPLAQHMHSPPHVHCKCEGYIPNVPQPFVYPFQIHSYSSLPFTFAQSALFSVECSGVAEVGQSNCHACFALASFLHCKTDRGTCL